MMRFREYLNFIIKKLPQIYNYSMKFKKVNKTLMKKIMYKTFNKY